MSYQIIFAPGVRAYKISTIVDSVALLDGRMAGVRAYKISTIVDVLKIVNCKKKGVRAYKISTIVDRYCQKGFC